jgi:hypothetical protein
LFAEKYVYLQAKTKHSCDKVRKGKVMEGPRKQTTVRLPGYMLADLNAEARRQGISVSRLIEDRLEASMYHPNKETLEALEEARSGEDMERLSHYDIEHFEEYVSRL